MAKDRVIKAKPRRERSHPQTELLLSKNFPDSFRRHRGTCYVPLEDFRKLEKKYHQLFNRYKRTLEKT